MFSSIASVAIPKIKFRLIWMASVPSVKRKLKYLRLPTIRRIMNITVNNAFKNIRFWQHLVPSNVLAVSNSSNKTRKKWLLPKMKHCVECVHRKCKQTKKNKAKSLCQSLQMNVNLVRKNLCHSLIKSRLIKG